MDTYSEPYFRSDALARAKIESIRWPNGPVCSHCGETESRYATKKEGRWRCGNPACRKDYTVTTGTVMESTHIGLHKWMLAFYLLSSSKKGMSSHQLMRSLDVTYKSAWFLSHRVRKAMESGGLTAPPMGGDGGIVEVDETYHGKQENPTPSPQRRGRPYIKKNRPPPKRIIVSLVERHGSIRSFHVGAADKTAINNLLADNVAKDTRIHTDESGLYVDVAKTFASHETVNHSIKEYARDDIHVNSAEGYFGLLKRGFNGFYHHCREKHLHRYLSEYDFRYNHRIRLGFNDMDRTIAAVKGAEGKRLTYRQPGLTGL